MKKICIVSGFFHDDTPASKGGAEYQNFLLAHLLKEEGYNVAFISYGNKSYIDESDGLKIYYIKKNRLLRHFGKSFVFDFFKVINRLKIINPDIIYQRTGLAYTGFCAYYAQKNKKRFIWAIGSSSDLEPFKFSISHKVCLNYIDKKICEYGIRRADTVIAQADYQKDLLLTNYGKVPSVVIPNYHPYPKIWETQEEKNVQIAWIANFSKNKNPEKFVEIAESFSNKNNIKFIMAGRPYSRRRQIQFEKKLAFLKNVIYLGALKQIEVNKIISSSILLINTSYYEGLPNTFIQAWLRGVPVASLHVDPDNVIREKEIGYFADGDFVKLIAFIAKFTADEELRQRLSRNAYDYACRHYTIESQQKKLLRLFK